MQRLDCLTITVRLSKWIPFYVCTSLHTHPVFSNKAQCEVTITIHGLADGDPSGDTFHERASLANWRLYSVDRRGTFFGTLVRIVHRFWASFYQGASQHKEDESRGTR